VRQAELRAIISEQVVDVQDLVQLLELTIEDILAKHPAKLREHAHKFGVVLGEAEENPEQ
jgi:chorismate mutase